MQKNFLTVMITAFCISALIGIVIFLIGDMGVIQVKILINTLFLGFYSLLGLCCSPLYEKNRHIISLLGIYLSIFGFIVLTLIIWTDQSELELLFSLIILPISFAQASLILSINSFSQNVTYVVYSTVVFIAILALLLLNILWSWFETGDFYIRLIGIVAILDVLGTIVSPILNKMYIGA